MADLKVDSNGVIRLNCVGQLTYELGQHKVDRAVISEANFGYRSSAYNLD
jgi:hypothetical protein